MLRISDVQFIDHKYCSSGTLTGNIERIQWDFSCNIQYFRTVYERVSQHRTLAVFITSSIWHGFYPGYYMMFLTFGLMLEAGRMVTKVISFNLDRMFKEHVTFLLLVNWQPRNPVPFPLQCSLDETAILNVSFTIR